MFQTIRKLKAVPDHELDWRNENCPCIRVAIDIWGNPMQVVLSPEENVMVCTDQLRNYNYSSSPHWSEDPTYNMAIRKPRRRRL